MQFIGAQVFLVYSLHNALNWQESSVIVAIMEALWIAERKEIPSLRKFAIRTQVVE